MSSGELAHPFRLVAAGDRAAAAGPLASSAGTVFRGAGRAVLSGTGFLPWTEVAVVVYPTRQLIGIARTDEAGAFRATVPLPSTPGAYTLVAVGGAMDADDLVVRNLTLPIVIRRST